MAAITDYATLSTAMADWAERSDFDTDQIIGLAEAEFRLHLGPHFSKQSSGTLAVVAGVATLPTGLVRVLSLVHATYGAPSVNWSTTRAAFPACLRSRARPFSCRAITPAI